MSALFCRLLKGTVSVISSDPSCKNDNAYNSPAPHPYKHILYLRGDSMVPENTLYDLMVDIDKIQKGELKDAALFVRAERKSKTKDIKS